MSKWVFAVGAAVILGAACEDMRDRFQQFDCPETLTSCRVVYSAFYGYQRACSKTCANQIVPWGAAGGGADDGDRADDARAEESSNPDAIEAAAATPGAASGRNLGAAAAPEMTRYSAFDGPCERDSQCGPGKCLSGNCYYGCQSDAQCGSGDRCAVESGVRICLPDPNPPVLCTRSAQCEEGFMCLNGGCRQSCTSTEQCDNLLDRCSSGVCLPDRRPLSECVVNSECDDGLVCLDGACVPACPAERDAGVCLAEPTPNGSTLPAPETPQPTEPQGGSEDTASEPGDDDPTPDEPAAEDDEPSDDDDETGDSDPEVSDPEGTPPDAGVPIGLIE
jgi:hypothetical protein